MIFLILEKLNFLLIKKNSKISFFKHKFSKLLYFLKYQNYWLLNKNSNSNLQTKIFTQFIIPQQKDRSMNIIHINHHQLKTFQMHSLKHKEIYILHQIDLLKYHWIKPKEHLRFHMSFHHKLKLEKQICF
jgi:hypothetical protein